MKDLQTSNYGNDVYIYIYIYFYLDDIHIQRV